MAFNHVWDVYISKFEEGRPEERRPEKPLVFDDYEVLKKNKAKELANASSPAGKQSDSSASVGSEYGYLGALCNGIYDWIMQSAFGAEQKPVHDMDMSIHQDRRIVAPCHTGDKLAVTKF